MPDDALRAARALAVGLDPAAAAARIGAQWDDASGLISLPFFGGEALVTYPDLEVTLGDKPPPPHIAALIVHHLAKSDGSRPSGQWISFADLPNGSFYVTAFRGYTGDLIARRFCSDAPPLEATVHSVRGEELPGLGDRAWGIPALPRVPIALLWWDADDEFGARSELLFDHSASRHLPTDGCAILGSWLTSLLIRAAELQPTG